MKRFRKISKMVFATAACSMALLSAVPCFTMQADAAASTGTETVSPQADVKVWIFEERSDGLWKRLFNTTKGIWEGEWIYVGPPNN